MENILAVLIGEPQDMGNGIMDTGQRALLSVTYGIADVAKYTFYGDSLYMIWHDAGQFTSEDAFRYFAKQFYCKPMTWFQLATPPPNPLMGASRIYLVPTPPPPDPLGSGTMTLIDSGYDPFRGFYLTFAGNFDLTCPIFKGFNGMTRNIPNYQIREG